MPSQPANFYQVPTTVNLHFVAGDTLPIHLDFGMDISAYDFTATVLFPYPEDNLDFTITPVDLVAGKIDLSLTAADTATILADTQWVMTWTLDTVVRTIFRGHVYLEGQQT
jgi:hypothetical protein